MSSILFGSSTCAGNSGIYIKSPISRGILNYPRLAGRIVPLHNLFGSIDGGNIINRITSIVIHINMYRRGQIPLPKNQNLGGPPDPMVQ